MDKNLLSDIISNSTWKKEPDFIEEYQLGCEEYVVIYNIEEPATEGTYDTPGTAMELSIVQIFIKGWDVNENEVVFDMTDILIEFNINKLDEFLYEAHIAKHGD